MIERCPNCRERVFFTGSICPNCGCDRDHPQVGKPETSRAADASGPATSRPADFWAGLALIVLAVCSFLVDWTMVSKSGSIDFRNRATGLRLLVAAKDPYHTKWSLGESERFCDPYENPALPITKTTVTPTTLLAGWPWVLLPYPIAKTLWLFGQWILLAGLWAIWFRWPGHTSRSRWCWTALVVGFTYTLAWRHHIDRGQAYLLWVFLLAAWMRLSLGKCMTKNAWLPGLVAGVLVCMRPPLLLVVAPFLVLRRRNQWLGAIVGVILGLGVPVLMKPGVWQDYGQAMATWSTVYRNHSEPRPGQRAFPPEVEGMPIDQLARYEVRQFVDSSLFRLGRACGWLAVPAQAMLALLGLLFGVWLWQGRRGGDVEFVLGLAAWTFLADAFLPAYRYPYVDVMILNTLALIPAMRQLQRTSHIIALLATLAGIWMVSTLPPAPWLIYLPTLALAAIALLALQQSAAARANHPNPPSTC